MDTTHTKNNLAGKAAPERGDRDKRGRTISDEHDEMALQERVDKVRDMVEDLRDRAEMAFHERPYLLPVATGALGLGVGVLIGSKLSRILFFTAAGAMLSDRIRGEIVRISRDFIDDLGVAERGEESEDVEDAERLHHHHSVT